MEEKYSETYNAEDDNVMEVDNVMKVDDLSSDNF